MHKETLSYGVPSGLSIVSHPHLLLLVESRLISDLDIRHDILMSRNKRSHHVARWPKILSYADRTLIYHSIDFSDFVLSESVRVAIWKIRINIHITNRIRTQCITITMTLGSVNKLESNIPKSNSLFLETYCCVVWNTDNSRASKMRSYSERAKINWRIFTHVIFLLKVSKVQAFSKTSSPSI